MLLEFVDTGRARRVGSTTNRRLDVRLISTTNQALGELVERRKFRSDLLHRIRGSALELSPLRERRSEILPIIRRQLNSVWSRDFQERDEPPPSITRGALEELRRYPWPGNFRELTAVLGSVLERIEDGIVSREIVRATLDEWSAGLTSSEGVREPALPAAATGSRYRRPASAAAERVAIMEALRAEGGVKRRAARRLKMSRTTLYTKLADHAITEW